MERRERARMSEVTVQELDDMIGSYLEYEEVITKESEVLAEKSKKLETLRAKIVLTLKDLNREEYESPVGKAEIVKKWRVNLPATDQDKAALFEHLRERKIFDKYATVNSNSLNSLYMADWKAAEREGKGMDYKMPGIEEPKLYETSKIKPKK